MKGAMVVDAVEDDFPLEAVPGAAVPVPDGAEAPAVHVEGHEQIKKEQESR